MVDEGIHSGNDVTVALIVLFFNTRVVFGKKKYSRQQLPCPRLLPTIQMTKNGKMKTILGVNSV